MLGPPKPRRRDEAIVVSLVNLFHRITSIATWKPCWTSASCASTFQLAGALHETLRTAVLSWASGL
jgi:hypothetical protein